MTAEQREAKEMRKALQTLSDTVLLGLDALDKAVATRRDLPTDFGHWLGKWVNTLDMANDSVRYAKLGVDYRKDDKDKAVLKIKKARSIPRGAPSDHSLRDTK